MKTFFSVSNITISLLGTFLLSCTTTDKKIEAAVVSAREEASKIGVSILARGGTAYDAMIATDLALAVCYPNAGNIGGGGFFVYRTADGQVGTLDYREKAPAGASENMYLDDAGNVIEGKSTLGGLAVGVPGTIAGLFEIHGKMGTLPFETLIQPAIDLARNGYVVTEKQARSFTSKREEFVLINGEQTLYAQNYKAGDTIKNEAMARTLEQIRDRGKAGFYSGPVAQQLVEKVAATGGIITLEDLENYEPVWRTPINFKYKNLNIYSMAPPSSGGICIGQMFQMVAPYDLGQYPHNSLEAIQVMVEAERRSYADRSKFLGDPDFVSIPVDSLLDSRYLDRRMASFDWEKASLSSDIAPGSIVWEESEETTHYSIVDRFGNAVAVTTTLNGSYGSKVFVEEGGYFLNNEMDDFSSKPGVPNMFGLVGSGANAIAPQKRMLSSMTPTIVEKDGQLAMVVGTPGGSTIITSVFQTILNVFEFGMGMQEAVDAPRFHHQWLPDSVILEPGKFDPALIKALQDKGYNVAEQYSRIIGRVDAILVDDQKNLSTGADPRGDDAAAVIYKE